MQRARRSFFVRVGVTLLGWALLSLAFAVEFTVDATHDAVDADPEDGVCATAEGDCTLRAAVQQANDPSVNVVTEPPTIVVPSGTYVLTLEGRGEDAAATGDLDLTHDMTITGDGAAGTIIDAGGIDRAVHVDPGRDGIAVQISGLTVRNGSSDASGGGIANLGTLGLTDVAVTGNRAEDPELNLAGGGIYNDGTLTLEAVTVADNRAADGAGLFVEGGTEATLSNSTVGENVASQSAGGINNNGTLTITGSTINGNAAEQFRAGGIKQQGTLTLVNATLSGNHAVDDGGAIEVSDLAADTELRNVTIAENSADDEGGGLYLFPGATASLGNTLLAGNTNGDCGGDAATSAGHNLDGDESCGFSASGDLSGAEANLGALADNGGATRTHALQGGSAAIDAGDDTACPEQDQRGEARPLDGDGDGDAVCDIGAFEAAATPEADLGVQKTSTPEPVSVRQELTYELEVTNHGPDHADGVTLRDTLPDGVAFESASAGCSEAEGVVTCDLGGLASGASASVSIIVLPEATGALTNRGSVAFDGIDPEPANDEAERDSTVTSTAESAVAVEAGPNPPGEATVDVGEAGVPMLQASLTAGEEALTLASVTLRASGSGDDAADVIAVRVHHDVDADGAAGDGEPQVAAGGFADDDGRVTLPLETPLELPPGEPRLLLVTYDLAAGTSASPVRPVLALAPLALLLALAVARGVSRRALLTLPLLLLLAGCPTTEDVPADGEEPGAARTYQVELSELSFAGNEPVVSGLPLPGPEVTVSR